MPSVRIHPLPEAALLHRHREAGAYTDCYAVEVPGIVSFEAYVAAFYTTALFKLERLILRLAIARPSTDAQARELAAGTRDRFAAWDVEARGERQLLLRDLHGRTASWLMTEAVAGGTATRLYFGSAVMREPHARTGKPAMAPVFRALLGFHKLYSAALLRAAARRLARAAG